MLWQAIDNLEAQETLLAMKVIATPHMKKEDQEKNFRYLSEMATLKTPIEINQKVHTSEDLAAAINGKLRR